ncbi:GvpL/GvpF family gas vesicle protein [Promicromonospora sp. NPDC057138]|uniref:GvpL/GvpF family gas vesicle protein n=1 Tax=Promicromonospora sp. NPDC057138 TaxID=3346031 RepID=UPI00362FA1AE
MSDDHEQRAGQSLYLYGLVQLDERVPDGLIGVQDEPVHAERLAHVTALVSDLPGGEVLGRAAEVRAHAAVVDTMAGRGAVLPIQFGATADGLDAIGSALPAERQQDYVDNLRKLADVVQLSLTARYDQDAIIAELVREDPEIRRLREITRGQPEEAMRDARIRLGELVVAGFDRKRAADADFLEGAVVPLVQELRHREVTQVDVVLDAALLVRRDAVARFEDALEDVAAGLVGRITLRLVGPQAPYDFAEEV